MDSYASERELGNLKLERGWLCLRWISCSGEAKQGSLLWGVIYGLAGFSCREEELRSWNVTVNSSYIRFHQTIYECGLCCKKDLDIILPLERVTSVNSIEQGCCQQTFCCKTLKVIGDARVAGRPDRPRDCCGNTPDELKLEWHCVKNPKDFRSAVLSAKNKLQGPGVGQTYVSWAPPSEDNRAKLRTALTGFTSGSPKW